MAGKKYEISFVNDNNGDKQRHNCMKNEFSLHIKNRENLLCKLEADNSPFLLKKGNTFYFISTLNFTDKLGINYFAFYYKWFYTQ